MRHPSRGALAAALAAAAIVGYGCNKAPAGAALEAAEQTIAAARPELQRYAPDELVSLGETVKEARAQFDKGNYTAALRAAQAMPAKVEAAVAAANGKKAELTAAWNQLASVLPASLTAMKASLADAIAGNRLPRGMDRAKAESTLAEVDAALKSWKAAAGAFQAGEVPRALETAQELKAKVDTLTAALASILPATPSASKGAGG